MPTNYIVWQTVLISNFGRLKNTSYLQCWVKEEEELLREAIVIREEREICDEIRQRKVEIGMAKSSKLLIHFFFFSLLRLYSFLLCFLLPHSSFFEFATGFGGNGSGFIPGD